MIPTLEWTSEEVRFLDQTELPLEETYVLATDYQQVATVIRDMMVRGAPAIGVSAAMGVALGVSQSPATSLPLPKDFDHIGKILAGTRPTAVNLFWAIERMRHLYNDLRRQHRSFIEDKAALIAEAKRMYDEDIAACKRWEPRRRSHAREGAVLTHCNAGALATCGYGTALGVIRAAVERGHKIHVFADETRPFLQGARLTAWELMHDDIPTTVLCDNMAASLMREGKIQAVIVGADRIAANGDVANKIGTYGGRRPRQRTRHSVLCRCSLVDHRPCYGDRRRIPIEQRAAIEVTHSWRQANHAQRRGHANPGLRRHPGKVRHRHHYRARSPARSVWGIHQERGDGGRSRLTAPI